ncbi:hypothetical protein PSPO01_06425 [Paraphaeosphaeria sporulosa]
MHAWPSSSVDDAARNDGSRIGSSDAARPQRRPGCIPPVRIREGLRARCSCVSSLLGAILSTTAPRTLDVAIAGQLMNKLLPVLIGGIAMHCTITEALYLGQP